jgi:phenylalanyl-tRNA synthetase beta subunit
LPNLIQTVQENLKQGNNSIEGFELDMFFLVYLSNFQEKEYVAGIFGGISKKNQLGQNPENY